MTTKNYGSQVTIIYKNRQGLKVVHLRNVTEIHYNYPSLFEKRIAFESDIHQTGLTVDVADIDMFETFLETKKEKAF